VELALPLAKLPTNKTDVNLFFTKKNSIIYFLKNAQIMARPISKHLLPSLYYIQITAGYTDAIYSSNQLNLTADPLLKHLSSFLQHFFCFFEVFLLFKIRLN